MAKSSSRVVVETLLPVRHGPQPATGQGQRPVEAGVQVRLVRSRVREGGPVVGLVEVVRSLRMEER